MFLFDFKSLFGRFKSQKVRFSGGKTKLFAKSPCREKLDFGIDFGTILVSFFDDFGIIFRSFFDIDFCIGFL